jgi:hypothetical protein
MRRGEVGLEGVREAVTVAAAALRRFAFPVGIIDNARKGRQPAGPQKQETTGCAQPQEASAQEADRF